MDDNDRRAEDKRGAGIHTGIQLGSAAGIEPPADAPQMRAGLMTRFVYDRQGCVTSARRLLHSAVNQRPAVLCSTPSATDAPTANTHRVSGRERGRTPGLHAR